MCPTFDPTARLNGFDTRDHAGCLLADHFLKLTQLLLNDTSYFFDSAFCFKVRIVSQLARSLFSRTFYIVKIAFNLLPCAVCHFLPGTYCSLCRTRPTQ
jgi:hypothetical protein